MKYTHKMIALADDVTLKIWRDTLVNDLQNIKAQMEDDNNADAEWRYRINHAQSVKRTQLIRINTRLNDLDHEKQGDLLVTVRNMTYDRQFWESAKNRLSAATFNEISEDARSRFAELLSHSLPDGDR